MRMLPDSPSLDHLRQQAKDLLPHLRSLRPSATLSDAQAAVAEQYGYRTWPDRIRIALDPSEGAEDRELAARAVPTLLTGAPPLDRHHAILQNLQN